MKALSKPDAGDFDRLSREFIRAHGDDCAVVTFSRFQAARYLVVALLLPALALYRWDYFVFFVSGALMLLYFAGSVQKLAAALAGWKGGVERVDETDPIFKATADELPIYTIFLPLYREEAIAEKIVSRISALDYPPERLDVKLLLETDDRQTAAALEKISLPPAFEIVTAPPGIPRTKPRACNYGLERARGELCVIYDAEDIPERDQLRKAAAVFRRPGNESVACVQAKLNYHNRRQNWLTRMFTIEYSTTFDLYLPGLSRIGAPLPLGGTSNHFRTEVLRELGGWDPFNVTEDCDLGMRIGRRRYRTLMLDSTTWEEANSQLGNFIRQRSRWVKGFMQTHLYHARHPFRTLANLGLIGTFHAILTVGGSVLMMLTNLLCWPLLLLYIALLAIGWANGVPLLEQIIGPRDPALPDAGLRAWHLVYCGPGEHPWWSGLSIAFGIGSGVLLVSNLLLVGVGLMAAVKRGWRDLYLRTLWLPVYWVIISIAAWKGAIQLFTNPFYWEKTRHGLDSAAPPEAENREAPTS